MGKVFDNLKFSREYVKAFLKWIVLAILVGGIGGIIGSVFHLAIDYVTEIRVHHDWVLFLLPLGGLAIAGIYAIFKKQGKLDTNRVLKAATADEKVPLIMAPLIFISTVLTHLLGGSAGREGAALQLGGSIGYNIGRVCRLKQNDMHIIVMAGMSGVFAALFGTPVTAAVFAIEVVCVGVMHYAALVPCVISAMVSFGVAGAFGIAPVHFDGVVLTDVTALTVGKIALLALLCALVSIVFCSAIHVCEHTMEKFLKNKYLRAVVGALILVVLTLLVGTRDYNGAGMDVITRAIGGEVRWEAFLLKIVFTAITIAAGFKGGEIVPAFFIGSTFGCFVGSLLGIDPGFAAAVGFVAVFCGVVNCPLASTILALEVFGGENILLFTLVCAISYMMSGSFGLYKSQKIVYSKLDAHYIDIETR